MVRSTLIALSFIAASGSVNAGGVPVWSWDYINEAGFTGYTTDAANGKYRGIDGAFEGKSEEGEFASGSSILSSGSKHDLLCWGNAVVAGAPSCLGFKDDAGNDTSRVEGVASTTGIGKELEFSAGTSIQHNNFAINPPKLTSVSILDALQLDNPALLMPFVAPEITFNAVFLESKNDANGQTCVERVDPLSELAELEKAICPDDVFFIEATGGADILEVNVAEQYIDLGVDIDLTGYVPAGYHTDYQIVTRLSGLVPIPGLPPGVFGLITEEGSENFLKAQFAVRLVSEPATVAIFGLGLVLAGLATRRRKHA